MKEKEYCIFNKQYSKNDREKLVARLIEKMQDEGQRGLFFDSYMSTSPFNDTVAYDYYPVKTLTKPDGEIVVLNESSHGNITIEDEHIFVTDAILDL